MSLKPPTPTPRTLTCVQVMPLLPGFVGDEPADEQLSGVRAHLRDCVGCRREAADFMQANKALRRAAEAAVHDHQVSFDAMHEEIMRRVTVDDVVARASWVSPGGDRLMVAAAAVLLATFGFWLGTAPEPESIWDRQGGVVMDDGVVVLPYAGSPADIRPVGLDSPGGAENGVGTGMSARGPYRTQVEPAVLYRTSK